MLWGIDQNGTRWDGIDAKRPKASLLERIGARSAQRMYRDNPDGSARHVGYVVSLGRGFAPLWVSLFSVTEWNGGRHAR